MDEKEGRKERRKQSHTMSISEMIILVIVRKVSVKTLNTFTVDSDTVLCLFILVLFGLCCVFVRPP